MTDLSVASQGALSEEHISSIREVQQAFAMYNLSVKLLVAFISELGFCQVPMTVATSPTRDFCMHHLNAASQPTQHGSNRLLQDPSNLLTHLMSCNFLHNTEVCTARQCAEAQSGAGHSVWLQVHTAVQCGRPVQRPVTMQRCCKQHQAACTSAAEGLWLEQLHVHGGRPPKC